VSAIRFDGQNGHTSLEVSVRPLGSELTGAAPAVAPLRAREADAMLSVLATGTSTADPVSR